jgi:hypothetical protein
MNLGKKDSSVYFDVVMKFVLNQYSWGPLRTTWREGSAARSSADGFGQFLGRADGIETTSPDAFNFLDEGLFLYDAALGGSPSLRGGEEEGEDDIAVKGESTVC